MTRRINELSERIDDRLAELRNIREILADFGEAEGYDLLLKSADRMYSKLSELSEEIKSGNGEA
ncbi:hypothetical protein [Ruminococcus sp. HUN007]|uniref:hypothetical protein n=1 Tax=Ruminococcus sp. HUN007 TaxID=1514668 RepID=UPI0005D207C4|nr:hypothetical protein [Ruminococcus sp. HUN007]